jgi:uncharacterized protein (TIGR03000 family)
MKYTIVRFALAMLLGAAVSSPASAGWGLFGHGSGGSTGGGSAGYASSGGAASYGSSGGGVVAYAGYGSSGGGAAYGSSGGGSSGGYVAAYGSSGGGAGSGGSSGQPGILSRLANRIHTAHDRIHSHFAAKAARHAGSSGGGSSGGYFAQGSSGGGYASGGSSGGGYYSSYGSYGGGSSGSASFGSSGGAASYGSTGSSYGSVGSSLGSVGSYYGASTRSSAAASSLVSSSASVSEDTVQLNVAVPADAVVYVNDRKTTSKGEKRQFVSRGLEAGKTYRFEIRAELNNNGKVVTDTKTVVATAGAQENVRFAFEAPKSDKMDTAVVLNVPENAEVTLAGNATQVKGASRTFKTSQMKAGEVWDDYEIKVKVGDQVKSQTIRLIAGDKLELSFNFDESKDLVAAR